MHMTVIFFSKPALTNLHPNGQKTENTSIGKIARELLDCKVHCTKKDNKHELALLEPLCFNQLIVNYLYKIYAYS